MRAYLFVWVAALGFSVVVAAPVPPGPPPAKDRKQLRSDSRRFAQQLNGVIDQIVDHYVRPVSRENLMEAAVVGLYQAGRRPAPRDLRQQVRQAISLSALLHAQGPQIPAPPTLASARLVEDPRERFLARMREGLGSPEGLAGQDPVLICCKAMARLLDRHSGLVTAEEQRRAVGLDYESFGPGLEVRDALGGGPLVVEAVQLGGPAQRAGLRPGDVISHIDGRPVAKAPPRKLLALRNQRVIAEAPLRAPGEEGEKAKEVAPPAAFRLTWRRPGEKEDRQATLIRERFRPETVLGVSRRDDGRWNYLLDETEKTAQVRLTTLSRGTAEDLRAVLVGLCDRKVRGVVLDLRWCPGGYLNESVDVADLFLGNGAVATVKSRGREDVVYRSTEQNKFLDFALVVLVNGDTSGGAELIAAALQDHRRAAVVGQRTRGKASVQTPLPVGVSGVGFKLTSGTFHRPSGKNLHRFEDGKPSDDWGVLPDEDCRLSPELGRQLLRWWRLYSLRPASSRERLALDDPRADPQRLTAQAVLRKRLEAKGQGEGK
jgi:C-terminal processing protease CtpA/Prc